MIASARSLADPFGVWCERWGLEPDGEPIRTAGASLLPVRRGVAPAMLKLAHEAEERFGAALMTWWNGHGAARVLAQEDEALMLERAMGSRSLDALSRSGREGDEEACRILCAAIGALHAPRSEPPPSLIPLERWFGPLLGCHERYGGRVGTCAEMARTLLAEQREPAVLHGDIHHCNVLDFGPRGWLAIDPKGLRGERAFDYANLFRNGHVARDERSGEHFARRLDVVSASTGLERRRLAEWTMVLAALSSVWRRNEGDDAPDDLFILDLCAAELGGL